MELQRSKATGRVHSLASSLKATPRRWGGPSRTPGCWRAATASSSGGTATDPSLHVRLLLLLAERYYENDQYDLWQATISAAPVLQRRAGLGDVELRAARATRAPGSSAWPEDRSFDEADRMVASALEDLAAMPGRHSDPRPTAW